MNQASHNEASDNGVKLVDPMGEMLTSNWEIHATNLANANESELRTVLDQLIQDLGLSPAQLQSIARVIYARDTRCVSECTAQ